MSQPTLDQLFTLRLSRRDVLKLGATSGLCSLLGLSQSACSTLAKNEGGLATLGFNQETAVDRLSLFGEPRGYWVLTLC